MDTWTDKFKLDFRLRLSGERIFYGPGAHQLLQLTEETGSLRAACQRMGMSYSKGRKIIAITEQQLGCQVIESHPGGKNGGYSSVTETGKKLIQNYTALCAAAAEELDGLFRKYFCD